MILLLFLRSVDSRLEATEGISEAASPPKLPPPPAPEPHPSPGVTLMVERPWGWSLCSDWPVFWVWTVTMDGVPTVEVVITICLPRFWSMDPSRAESELSESTLWSLCSTVCLRPDPLPTQLVPVLPPTLLPWSSDRHLQDPLPSVDGAWITGLLFSGWASTLIIAPVLPEMLPVVLPSELGPVVLIGSWSVSALYRVLPWQLPLSLKPMLLSSKLLEWVWSRPCCLDIAITCMIRGWVLCMFPVFSAALCQLAWTVLLTVMSLAPVLWEKVL